MEVLVVGGGGREHAVADKLAQESAVSRVFVAPGNAGTEATNKIENVDIAATDIAELLRFARQNKPDITAVGSEDALALGIVDEFTGSNIPIFGPTREAAKIEAYKSFAKSIMGGARVPTAEHAVFFDPDDALHYMLPRTYPQVVKADGLMQGHGVSVCYDHGEAELAIHRLATNGSKMLVEDFLEGFEVSLHAISDGKNFYMFPVAKDHKTLYEDNKGPMTGGMGMIAPIEGINIDVLGEQIVEPLLSAMRERGTPFKGVLYPGVILTPNGPKVIEFNARFGDPEAQGYMRLLKSGLLEVMTATVDGTLGDIELDWSDQHVATVALAAYGYPVMHRTGDEITGLQGAEKIDGVKVYHGGTKRVGERIETSGGRVLHVTATGGSPGEAKERAYQATQLINFEDKQFRRDIGSHVLRA